MRDLHTSGPPPLRVRRRDPSCLLGRVLVIADDPAVVSFLDLRLRAHGFAVDSQVDSLEGLAWARRHAHSYDLAIVELSMRPVGGLEVLRAIRAAAPRARVLTMSANPADGPSATHAAGAAAFLREPFTARELLVKVREALAEPAPYPPRRAVTAVAADDRALIQPVRRGVVGVGPGLVPRARGEHPCRTSSRESPPPETAW